MTNATEPSEAASWEAARTHPHTYPGRHPEGAFALVDGMVHVLTGTPTEVRLAAAPLDRLLTDRGLPVLAHRFPVLAYGGNRNPATLALKLEHYGYRSPGRGTVLPVLTATLDGYDVVGAALSGQGYLYGDLVPAPGTTLAVHVLLLDDDQLRVLHDSEGVRAGFYDVGVLDSVQLGPDAIAAMAYLARAPSFVSPTLGRPLAYSAVRATGRTLPAFDPLPMLAHALDSTDLLAEVAAVVRPGAAPPVPGDDADALDVAAELLRYLNGQWWFRRHTGLPGLRAATALQRRIDEVLLACSAPTGMTDGRPATVLDEAAAYTADPARTLGGR